MLGKSGPQAIRPSGKTLNPAAAVPATTAATGDGPTRHRTRKMHEAGQTSPPTASSVRLWATSTLSPARGTARDASWCHAAGYSAMVLSGLTIRFRVRVEPLPVSTT